MLWNLRQSWIQPRSQGSLLPVPAERRVGERTWVRGCLGFWMRGTGFFVTGNGFRIPWAVVRIPQEKISWIPKFGFPYMGRTYTKMILPSAPVSSKPRVTPEFSFFLVPSQRMIKQNYLLLLLLLLEPFGSRRVSELQKFLSKGDNEVVESRTFTRPGRETLQK